MDWDLSVVRWHLKLWEGLKGSPGRVDKERGQGIRGSSTFKGLKKTKGLERRLRMSSQLDSGGTRV